MVMITQIGIVAGQIMTLIENLKRPVDINEIQARIDEPNHIVLMGLGWLIRESFVNVTFEDGTYVYDLNGRVLNNKMHAE